MRALCDVPWTELSVNDRLVGANGKSGRIIKLEEDVSRTEADDARYMITMRWDGRPIDRCHPHAWLDKVQYRERP